MSKFIKGMDLSTLLELERCGAKYYEDGKEKDFSGGSLRGFLYRAQAGLHLLRLST